MAERPVRHPRWPPGVGTHPGGALLTGAARIAIFGLIGYVALQIRTGELSLESLDAQQTDRIELGAGIVVVALLPALLHAVWLAVAGILDLVTPRRTVEGEVVEVETRRTGDWLPGWLQWLYWNGRDSQTGLRRESRRRRRTYVAIDEGGTGAIRALRVASGQGREVSVGEIVRTRVTRTLAHVGRFEVTGETARRRAIQEAAAEREAQRVDRITDALTGLIDSASSRLEAAGVDDELRRQVEEARRKAGGRDR